MRRLVLALAAVLAACRGGPDAVQQFPPALLGDQDGATLYRAACASCHGVDGRGGGPVAEALSTPPGDLTRLSERNGAVFPRDRVIAVITGELRVPAHGDREMPVWSQRFGPRSGATAAAAFYARRRVELLADHLASLQRDPGASPMR